TMLLMEDGRVAAALAIGTDGLDLPEALETDAAMVWLGQRQITLSDATRVGRTLSFEEPADVQIDLYSGEMTCSLPGEGALSEDDTTALRRAARSALTQLGSAADEAEGAGPALADAAGLARAWEVEPATHDGVAQPGIEMETHDLDGDGSDETLAIRGRYLTVLDADGSVRWEFDGKDELYAVGAYDIDGDGELEVFVGGKSKILYVLEADGTLVREHPIETYWRVSRTTIHEPRLDDVLVDDFDGDGEWEAALGTVDGFVQVINSDFSQRWIFGEVNHGTTELSAIDVNDDGVQEIAVGNRYGKLFVLSSEDGSVIGQRGSELGDVQMAVEDLDGDGTVEMVNGSATGALKVGQVGSRDILWQYPNFGYAWRDIKTADLTGDGALEVVACSDTGYVYAVDADGETVATRNLDSAVLDLAIVEGDGGPMVAAGTLSGMVYLLDANLAEIGRFPVGSRVNLVSAVTMEAGAQIVAALEDGRVVAVRR
ncbi:MAG: FG-GAP repeat domain-containing protein, partial [Armatimonadota bacterium]